MFSRLKNIQSVSLTKNQLQLRINGESHSYPFVFLQDNCVCPDCFHDSSKSRLRKLTHLDLKKKIVRADLENDRVSCSWSDGHVSVFTKKWLLERSFMENNIKARKTTPRDFPEFVGSKVRFDQFQFYEVLENKLRMREMLETVARKGVAMLNHAALKQGELSKLVSAIGFIRTTHYGNEFTVKSSPNAVNLAYTSARLNVHTDLPYYAYPPGVQALHCIAQFNGDGGESHLVDGFRVADYMKKFHSECYQTLCSVELEFYDEGVDYVEFLKRHWSPTFVTHPNNPDQLIRLVYSNQVLSSNLPVPLDKVERLYEALKVFTDTCYHEDNLIRFKLKEGQVVVFDNWRMLHGREAFDSSLGHRHLEGCYVDWDEIFSRINVIKELC